MARKVVAILFCAFLFSTLAVAAAEDQSYTSAPLAIELRQYMTMLIVGVVCIAGGVILFFKTSH
jgi:hypothetical protein